MILIHSDPDTLLSDPRHSTDSTFVYRFFDSSLPGYLSHTLCAYEPTRNLCSSCDKLLRVPERPKPLGIEKAVDKNGYLVLWSQFNQKPMQFLQEWCHMIVFGLSENEFCSIVLDSVSVKSASMVILHGQNCSSQAGMLRQMKRVCQVWSD